MSYRMFSFSNFHIKIPCSIIYNIIIKEFFIENKNANIIYKNLKEKIFINRNYNTILSIIKDFRRCIAGVYKQK